MFYPVDSLKRGGRFYLCWVADSWPLRFATITHRQLWSQDIRKICDDLLEVMTNESGRPTNRFSLRLSSQLLRGLVRLYQRKVTVFLGDLCMINANVTKNVNKKWNICEVVIDVAQQPLPQLPPAQLVAHEEPENEQRIVEIIQNSGNVVGNIDEITLKESAVPQVLLPPNDGFGEENPDQALQLLKDQTIETMLLQDKSVQDKSAVQHSGLDVALDVTDKSHDKSRLVTHEAQMEPISELDATMFRKSVVGDERLTMGDLEKEVPEIPEIPLPVPEIPVPSEPQMVEEARVEPPPAAEPARPVEATASPDKRQTQDIQLEELQQQPPSKRRRLKNKLIIDKRIKLTADYLVTRIENPHVELRCEDSYDDIVDIKTPVELLFRQPCCAGGRLHSNVGATLTRMYQRNLLSVAGRQPRADREMEEVAAGRTSRIRTRSLLERIEEEAPVIPERIEDQSQQPIREVETSKDPMNVEMAQVTMPMEQVDISELPTQKILITESQTLKRTSEYDVSPKRPRPSGYVSFRLSRQLPLEKTVSMIEPQIDKEHITRPCGYVSFSQQSALGKPSVSMIEIDKENIPGAANIRTPPTIVQQDNFETEQQVTTRKHVESTTARQSDNAERNLTVMLEAAGLADLPNKPEEQEIIQSFTQRVTRRGGSESSETPLGSLDRTKVSLGDSDQTTDSKRFIREQWGTEGTMVKILRSIKAGLKPTTVRTLIAKGPVMAGYKRIMAARCFNSILKLKQHGFIVIEKDLETREIVEILLGPKLSYTY